MRAGVAGVAAGGLFVQRVRVLNARWESEDCVVNGAWHAVVIESGLSRVWQQRDTRVHGSVGDLGGRETQTIERPGGRK